MVSPGRRCGRARRDQCALWAPPPPRIRRRLNGLWRRLGLLCPIAITQIADLVVITKHTIVLSLYNGPSFLRERRVFERLAIFGLCYVFTTLTIFKNSQVVPLRHRRPQVDPA